MTKKVSPAKSKKSSTLPLTLVNRNYHSQMRDTYFQKAAGSFGGLMEGLQEEAALFSEAARLMDFQSSLETTLEYAKQSVAGFKAEERKSHAETGFFREEIVFIHLLEDSVSASRYLITRYTTIGELSDYRKKISSLSLAGKSSGYVSRILRYIDEKNTQDELEIRQILKQIQNAIHLAGRVFETIKTKKKEGR